MQERDRWKKGEIDLVNLTRGAKWAVEVKWSDGVEKRLTKLKQSIAFCKRTGIDTLSITTRTKTAQTGIDDINIHFWPASLYAFAVGHSMINYRVRALELQLDNPS